MGKLTSRGFTAAEADVFMAACLDPHAVEWRVGSIRYQSGGVVTLAESLPIVAGSLVLDSSDPHRRQLTLELGGSEEFVATNPDHPAVPFGQILTLWCRVSLPRGGWSRWLKQGEYPVRTYSYERPSLAVTVEAQDYSAAVEEYAHLTRTGYSKRSLAAAVVQMVRDALPDQLTGSDDQHVDPRAASVWVQTYVAESGVGRWTAATDLAAVKGYECFFDSDGDLVIRPDITDDDAEAIPGVGPDIGTGSSPVARIADGPRGNLVALTATVSRQGAANGVFINLSAPTTRRVNGKTVTEDVYRLVKAMVPTGVVAWGDRFGRVPIVLDRPVAKITSAVVADQTRQAERLLHRRRGVIRYLDLDAVGLYWLEPDDRVRVQYAGHTEHHYVQRVEFDLTGRRPARIRTRQLAVDDPGPGA